MLGNQNYMIQKQYNEFILHSDQWINKCPSEMSQNREGSREILKVEWRIAKNVDFY
jgi:hypothetical protein